ncbi:mandelate racemase/muconate lactonizing enzyme family protein [Halobacterium jilantaiense]|uniref:o-succinylbenzoate synthase n=1 Tax=Halobacterium jilantaiense TaxID=355548 RepID=A0A1I0MRZ3_9EURY|nr:enolase C-terminal domain-like protein [Halobacterium jilantaiense]SEV91417.1 L-alanine-DL-glutamate epimerase [Halobacterium jilantaiense]
MIRPFSLDLSRPLSTASGTIDARTGFLFDREGGLGESTPLPGWTEPHGACGEALREAADAADWDAALAACEGTPAARHGVSLARLDASARRTDRSLARELGDDPADAVPVNATVGDGSVEATGDAVADAADAGFETVKVKVGARPVEEDVARLRAASEAADVTLRADANGAWSAKQTRRIADDLAEIDLEYLEQPISASTLDGYRGIDAVDVALDEALVHHDLDAVLDVADYVVLKPMALGGVDRAREAAVRARDAGVEPVFTTTIDAAVARAAAVHLAASVPDVPTCGLATADRLADDLAADPTPVADGHIRVPDGPGHGVEVERDA